MKLNEWIKKARLSSKLTQEQLGDALGKTKGNISQWESGAYEPSYSVLLKIAQITNYKEPLPGLAEVYNFAKSPFKTVALSKIQQLSEIDLLRLETGIELISKQLNLDILVATSDSRVKNTSKD